MGYATGTPLTARVPEDAVLANDRSQGLASNADAAQTRPPATSSLSLMVAIRPECYGSSNTRTSASATPVIVIVPSPAIATPSLVFKRSPLTSTTPRATWIHA